MTGAEKMAEKIPGWVERLLIPTLESRVRAVVKEEVGHLEKTMNAKFDAVNVKFDAIDAKFDAIDNRFDGVDARFDGVDARFDGVDARIESLEKRILMIQDIADLKARLAVVEKRTSA